MRRLWRLMATATDASVSRDSKYILQFSKENFNQTLLMNQARGQASLEE
jgi:hypothetical protein